MRGWWGRARCWRRWDRLGDWRSAKEPFDEQSPQMSAAVDHADQVNSVLQWKVEEENLPKPIGDWKSPHIRSSDCRTKNAAPLSGWVESKSSVSSAARRNRSATSTPAFSAYQTHC